MPFKKCIEVSPQGYCGGVRQAIEKVCSLRDEHPEARITILGSLVHNDYVRKALEAKNIHTLEAKGKTRLELLDEVESGYVVFTAHGVSQQVKDKAKAKGLEVLDASCPFVLITQKLVKEQLEKGSTVFYIGKKGHPEAEAVVTSHPGIVLIETVKDIPKDIQGPVFVTNQTTMSILDTQSLFDEIKKRCPQANIHDEICNATRVRQQAILNLKEQGVDALIVVGDPLSNNTRQLEAIGKMAGIPQIVRIEHARELDLSQLPQGGTVALTSGASTPTSLRKQVLALLEDPETPRDIVLEAIL